MKASIEQTELFKAMGRVQSIVEKRTTIPILSNVLIEARDDQLFLRTTDLDIEVLDKVKAVVEIPGALTVGANTFHEIVRKLPDGSLIQLIGDAGSNQLEISASKSRFFLSTLPKKIFQLWLLKNMKTNLLLPLKLSRGFLINQSLLCLQKRLDIT